MCGIAGLFHPFRPSVPPMRSLKAMAEAQRHRGPDGEGFHAEPHLGFGHRRLAIVDLAGGRKKAKGKSKDLLLANFATLILINTLRWKRLLHVRHSGPIPSFPPCGSTNA